MQTRLVNALVLIATTAIGLSAADNTIGTWKRNVEKSKYMPVPSNPFKSQIMVREAVDGGVKVTAKGERADGTPVESTYTVNYDGKPVKTEARGSNVDMVSVKQVDANTFITDSKKTGGKYHTTSRTVVSKDGKTMTTTAKGTDADGKPISFTIVFDKQ